MGEHLNQKQVEDYCLQRLEVADLLAVSDHVGECAACRQQLEYAMNGDAAFFALRFAAFGEAAETTSLHLTTEQLADYVDEKLSGDDLQFVTDHLTHCEPCGLAADDLQAFKAAVAPTLERAYRPATVASPTESWWQRMVATLPVLFRRSPGLAFGAALMILLLAVTAWLIWRTPPKNQPEIVETPAPAPVSPPAPTPQPVPTSPPAALVAQLRDGEGQLTLDQEGKLSGIDDLPTTYQAMLKDALTTRRIERSPELNGLARPPSSLMSPDKEKAEFSVIEPAGIVLLTARPTFRWSAMEGATGYVVEIYDSKFNLVTTSPELTNTSWMSPALGRGKVYSWQVKASKEGQEFKSPRPPAPQAKFRIVDQAKANELAKARQVYPSSHLMLGLLYAEAGLLKEAEQELRLLQKANPDSEIARRLLTQVQALRRRSQ